MAVLEHGRMVDQLVVQARRSMSVSMMRKVRHGG